MTTPTPATASSDAGPCNTGPVHDGLRWLAAHRWDAAGLLLATLFAVPAWFYPHGNDQALHWYLGQGILQGQLPFEHGISGKPIGIFLVHAIASALLGPGQWAIRVAETASLLAMAWMMPDIVAPRAGAEAARGPRVARRDGEWGCAALILFGVHYAFFDYWDLSHPETWVSLPMVAALRLSLTTGGRGHRGLRGLERRILWVGVLSGTAFMVKYTAAAIALPVAALCGLRAIHGASQGRRSWLLALVVAAACFLTGVAIVFALCVLPFWAGDALSPMWEVLYTLLVRYVGQAPGAAHGSLWVRPMFGGGVLALATCALLLGLALQLRRRATGSTLRGFAIVAVTLGAGLSIVLQGRFFHYHFVIVAPFLALCLHYGLHALGRSHGAIGVGLAVLLVAGAVAAQPRWGTHHAMSYARHTASLARHLGGEMPRKQYLRAFRGINRLDHYWIHEHIGLEARKRAQPGDQLCARGFATAIYQVSGLRCPSRHVIQMWPAGLPQWEPEFWTTLRETRPRFVVTFRDRAREVARLRRLGYRPRAMPSLFLLMERVAQRPSPAP